MMAENRIIFFILIVIVVSSCSNNPCIYTVNDGIEMSVKYNSKDISINDYSVSRKITLKFKNNEELDFVLDNSGRRDFYILNREIEVNREKINSLWFYNRDNSSTVVIDLDNITLITEYKDFDYCNCNEINCVDRNECILIEPCQ